MLYFPIRGTREKHLIKSLFPANEKWLVSRLKHLKTIERTVKKRNLIVYIFILKLCLGFLKTIFVQSNCWILRIPLEPDSGFRISDSGFLLSVLPLLEWVSWKTRHWLSKYLSLLVCLFFFFRQRQSKISLFWWFKYPKIKCFGTTTDFHISDKEMDWNKLTCLYQITIVEGPFLTVNVTWPSVITLPLQFTSRRQYKSKVYWTP